MNCTCIETIPILLSLGHQFSTYVRILGFPSGYDFFLNHHPNPFYGNFIFIMFIIEQLKKMSKLRYLLKARILLKSTSYFVSLLPARHVYSITVGRLVDTMFAEEVMLTFSRCL